MNTLAARLGSLDCSTFLRRARAPRPGAAPTPTHAPKTPEKSGKIQPLRLQGPWRPERLAPYLCSRGGWKDRCHISTASKTIPLRLNPPMTTSFHVQIAVPFRYEVSFTSDVFNIDNTDLAQALGRREPHKRHRAFFVIDAGVARAWPDLPDRIQR